MADPDEGDEVDDALDEVPVPPVPVPPTPGGPGLYGPGVYLGW